MLMARKPLFAMVLGVLFGMSSYAEALVLCANPSGSVTVSVSARGTRSKSPQAWWPGYKAQRVRLELPEPLVPPARRDR